MTPEERADAVMTYCYGKRWMEEQDNGSVWAQVKKAVCEAVAEEREDIAAMVENLRIAALKRPGFVIELPPQVAGEVEAYKKITAAIRVRTK